MHTTDITIIGAGLAGLLTANLLQHMAHSPLSITLIEANTSPGGLAQSHPIDSAYPHTRTNMGPHALYLNGPLHRLLRTLRIPTHGKKPTQYPTLIKEDHASFTLPTSLRTLLHNNHLTHHDKLTLSRALIYLSTQSHHHPDSRSAEDLLTSLARQSKRVLNILNILLRTTTYCASPHILQATTAHLQLKRSIRYGVLYLDGGWQSLIDALLARINKNPNISLKTKTKVTISESTPTHHILTTQHQERIHTTHLILAIPPHKAAKILPPNTLNLDALTPTKSACIDLLLKPRPHRPTSVYGLSSPFYMSNHSVAAHFHTHPTINDPHHVVNAAKYLPHDDSSSPTQHLQDLQQWLDFITPHWQEDTLAMRKLPTITVMHHTPNILPSPQLLYTPLPPHIHLVGDWYHNHNNILADAVASSTQHTYHTILTQDLHHA